MVGQNNQSYIRVWILFFLIAFFHMLSNGFINGRKISNSTIRNIGLVKHTIEVEDGDIIDCVDIYKQPAFSHPLLKNHTIQMRPSSYPSGLMQKNNSDLFQDWNVNGNCPEGTIPISRTQVLFNRSKAGPIVPDRTEPDRSFAFQAAAHEYAQVSVEGDKYFGAHARVNLWHPAIAEGEFSIAQIWVLAGSGNDFNSIEAGWMVTNGDEKTRLFIYWTRDNYQSTGCYNLNCPGFVQTNHKIAFGGGIRPVSTYAGKQYDIDILIHKDKQSGNWWLQVEGQALGYWPASILTSLAESSTLINWGGEITNLKPNGHHTSTQMGSGHFPGEGFGKASVICNLGYVDDSGGLKDPENLIPYVTKAPCYDLKFGKRGDSGFGVHFYFGGPGYSAQCP